MPTAISPGGIKLDYDVQGAGDPLLLIGGLTADRGIWGYVRDTLNAFFTTIAFDNRDVGKSDRATSPYSSADQAQDAIAVLDAAGYERVHILGHSMGGVAAQELALVAPERIRSLILANSFARNDTYTSELYKLQGQLRRRIADDHTFLSAMYFFSLGRNTLTAMPLSGLVSSVLEGGPPQEADAFLRQLAALATADTLDRLGAISAPTLILSSSDDKFYGDSHAEQLASGIAGAKTARIDGVGHCPMIENPHAFTEALVGFAKGA